MYQAIQELEQRNFRLESLAGYADRLCKFGDVEDIKVPGFIQDYPATEKRDGEQAREYLDELAQGLTKESFERAIKDSQELRLNQVINKALSTTELDFSFQLHHST